MVLAVIPGFVLVSEFRGEVRKMSWHWRSKKGTGVGEEFEENI